MASPKERQKHAFWLVMVAESAKWKKTLAEIRLCRRWRMEVLGSLRHSQSLHVAPPLHCNNGIRISFEGPTVYLTWQCDLRRQESGSGFRGQPKTSWSQMLGSIPIGSMGLVYLPTFGWFFVVNVGLPYMDHMGLGFAGSEKLWDVIIWLDDLWYFGIFFPLCGWSRHNATAVFQSQSGQLFLITLKSWGKSKFQGHFLKFVSNNFWKSSLRKKSGQIFPHWAATDQPPPASARDFGLWRPGKKRLPQRIRQEVGDPNVWI